MNEIASVLADSLYNRDLFLEIEGEKLLVENNQTFITNHLVCPSGSVESYGNSTYCGKLYVFMFVSSLQIFKVNCIILIISVANIQYKIVGLSGLCNCYEMNFHYS